jgi:hypothetical protein
VRQSGTSLEFVRPTPKASNFVTCDDTSEKFAQNLCLNSTQLSLQWSNFTLKAMLETGGCCLIQVQHRN